MVICYSSHRKLTQRVLFKLCGSDKSLSRVCYCRKSHAKMLKEPSHGWREVFGKDDKHCRLPGCDGPGFLQSSVSSAADESALTSVLTRRQCLSCGFLEDGSSFQLLRPLQVGLFSWDPLSPSLTFFPLRWWNKGNVYCSLIELFPQITWVNLGF